MFNLFRVILEDLCVHNKNILSQGFLAIAHYRVYHFFYFLKVPPRIIVIRSIFLLPFRVTQFVVEAVTGITIIPSTKIGRRFRIWHHGGIIIYARSIGDDVVIRQCTTLGSLRDNDETEIPIIGNRINIGCGVSILGGVCVEDDAKVGAHSLVLADVKCGSTVVGVPAREIKRGYDG